MEANKKRIAVVCANGIGDGLLSMVFAHNLEKFNYEVTTFSDHLLQLQKWFKQKQLQPFPQAQNVNETFANFDLVISTDGASLSKMSHNLGQKYKIYYERDFDRSKTVAENFLEICKKDFGLQDTIAANGFEAPRSVKFRNYPQRVIIHPMSTSDKKNWLPTKFKSLARKLAARNFTPVFIVSPKERQFWQPFLDNEFQLPIFTNLDTLAKYIYESGYMIGNDSGIGHLAANMGINTVSLFSRQSVSRLWRPNWNQGKVVVPTLQLPGARLRTKYWKNFLTVNKVFKTFLSLTVEK